MFYEEFYQNERLKVFCNYVDGELEGNYIEYYENGELKIICSYFCGKLNGLYQEFDENGNIIRENFYISGEDYNNI